MDYILTYMYYYTRNRKGTNMKIVKINKKLIGHSKLKLRKLPEVELNMNDLIYVCMYLITGNFVVL